MEINTLNYTYLESLFARLNDYRISDTDAIELLKEIVTIQGSTIDKLENYLGILFGDEFKEYRYDE